MKKTKWNEDWYFWEMLDSFALLWNVPENAQKVKLPHDAMLAHRAYEQSAMGGNSGYRDGGHFCYSKILEVSDVNISKYILQMDGVYENAAIYVNGNLVMRHPYGYTQFCTDLTPYLEENQKNEIRVMTNNKAVSSRWYPGGGIYRDVYLLTANYPVYILPDGIRIKTNAINESRDCAELEITAEIQNDTTEEKAVQLKFEIPGLCDVCTDILKLEADSQRTINVKVNVEHPLIWSEKEPNLLCCSSTLSCLEQKNWVAVDFCKTKFGIRKLELNPGEGFKVNGTPVKFRGACIHHDNGIIGAAEIKDAVYRKIKRMKQAGFNAIRMSHHPASTALLEVCDELGMFVMNESFDMWTRNKMDYDYANYFEDWWERDIEAMVISSCNHPSVVMYSLGNEIPEIGIRKGREICRMLQEKVKMLDDTRYTTVAINGVFSVGDIVPEIMRDVLGDTGNDGSSGNVNEFLTVMDQNIDKIVVHDRISERLAKVADIVDISGYNYMVARYEKDVQEYPDRIIVGSETYPPEVGRIWDSVKKYPQIIGDFTWTGWDYIGEAGVGIPAYRFGEGGFGAKFPCQLAYVGDIDITGFRRPASYYREIVYGLRKDPYIVVNNPVHFHDRLIKTPWVLSGGVANWNYRGMEGKPVCVEVYSPGDEVELFLNETSLGKKMIENPFTCKVEYEVPYVAGALRAVSYQAGSSIGETVLETPADNYHLSACVEEKMPELIYIEISCKDEHGIVYQTCEETVQIEVEGALESWLGSGNPKPDNNYTDMETKLWNGRALLVVRKESEEDKVSISISGNKESITMIL